MFQYSSALLTKQSIEVFSSGETVTLRIGNVDLPMHYEHALDMSRWIREEGAFAKRPTGRAKTLRSLGMLQDLNARAKPLALHRGAGFGILAKQRLRDWYREDVATEGRLVRIKVGSSVVKLHFESALKVAQWLRVRAKESQRTAGDERHWSTIGVTNG